MVIVNFNDLRAKLLATSPKPEFGRFSSDRKMVKLIG